MSPIPGWLSGAQSVCLNMSNVDLSVQLHFALVHGTGGYLLKPPGMRASDEDLSKDVFFDRSDCNEDRVTAEMNYWPPPRETLHCVTIDVLSLHMLPKVLCMRSWTATVSRHTRPHLSRPNPRLRPTFPPFSSLLGDKPPSPERLPPNRCFCLAPSAVSNDHSIAEAEESVINMCRRCLATSRHLTTRLRVSQASLSRFTQLVASVP